MLVKMAAKNTHAVCEFYSQVVGLASKILPAQFFLFSLSTSAESAEPKAKGPG
jgi:hypothetical protein